MDNSRKETNQNIWDSQFIGNPLSNSKIIPWCLVHNNNEQEVCCPNCGENLTYVYQPCKFIIYLNNLKN